MPSEMRQRAQQSTPAKDGSRRSLVAQTPPPHHRRAAQHQHTQLRTQHSGGSSGTWEITTDHVALNIEEVSGDPAYRIQQQRASPAAAAAAVGGIHATAAGVPSSSLSPQHLPHYHHPYQTSSGSSNTITEQQLRRFDELHKPSLLYPKPSPPASSVLLTSWKMDQRRLQDFHVAFRTPLHVPDSIYERHLLGLGKKENASIVTKECCAGLCAMFSGIAVLFLLFIGILLDTQPLYIAGSLPPLTVQSTVNGENGQSYTRPTVQYLVPGPSDERLPAATTAYHTAAAYFVCMLISLYVLDYFPTAALSKLFGGRNSRLYDTIPDHHHHHIDGAPNSGSGGALPTFHGDVRGSYSLRSVWNRTTGVVKRWMAVRGYKPRTSSRYASKKKG